jgi:purine-binding chemotaxis protein CheW
MSTNANVTGPDNGNPGTELLQLVSFQVGPEEFGVDILRVQEIIRQQDITHVPNLPGFVEGVINLRGKVIPVIGLRSCFGLEGHSADKNSRIVVVEVNGATLGFVVDAVSEVLRIPRNTVEPLPAVGKLEREYITGIGKLDARMLLLLDVDRVMTGAEQRECATAVTAN